MRKRARDLLIALGCAASAVAQPPEAPGYTGCVIDATGRPLAGVAVLAPDAENRYGGDPIARTDEAGRFRIPDGAVGSGCLVLFRKPGHASFRLRLPRAAAEIDDVVLAPGRVLTGRVRDASGEPLAGARVEATDTLASRDYLQYGGARHEPSQDYECATTDAVGVFVLRGALPTATTVEITASGHVPRVLEAVAAHTPLDVTLARASEAEPPPGARDRGAVAAGDLRRAVPEQPAAKGPETAVVARLSGVAHWADTGQPIAGIAVWALPASNEALAHHRFAMLLGTSAPPGAVTTGEDGTFELGGLAAGATAVFARHPQLGLLPLVTADLAAGEHREGFELKVAAHRVRLRPEGLPRDPRWRLRLERHAPNTISSARQRDFSGSVAAGTDGAFEFPRVLEGEWDVQLVCPVPPRTGRRRKMVVDVLKVSGAIDRTLDVSGAALPVLRGRVDMRGEPIPFERLIVVSEEAGYDGSGFYAFLFLQGTCGLVDVDGRFELPSPLGDRHLLLLDLLTGVMLGRSEGAVTVTAEGTPPLQLACEARAVDLRVTGATGAVNVDLYVPPESFPWGAGQICKEPQHHGSTLRNATLFPQRAEALRLYLPPGETEIVLRTGRQEVLASKTVTPRGRLTEVEIAVGQ